MTFNILNALLMCQNVSENVCDTVAIVKVSEITEIITYSVRIVLTVLKKEEKRVELVENE